MGTLTINSDPLGVRGEDNNEYNEDNTTGAAGYIESCWVPSVEIRQLR